MSATMLAVALGVAILATGLVAGVFLAFSDFVMRSLGKIERDAGCEAMQVVNREVLRTVFIVLLLGMAPYSAALAIYAAIELQGPVAAWIIAGSACYVVGTFLVTILCNVPMNNKLEALDHHTNAAAEYWSIYRRNWTRWNTVRTVAPVFAMSCYLVSFYFVAASTT